MAWKATDGNALDFVLICRLENDETGAVREVRKLAVPNGFIWHFVTIHDKQRTESCAFVPAGKDST